MTDAAVVETPRLRLRKLCNEDAGFLLNLTNQPDFLKNISDKNIRSIDDARRFIKQSPWTEGYENGLGQWLIECKDSNVAVGVCGLLYRSNLDLYDVGFALLPDHYGKGYATEAAQAAMEYGRTTLSLEKITGLVTENNAPSIKVLRRLGLQFDHIIAGTGGESDIHVYASTTGPVS